MYAKLESSLRLLHHTEGISRILITTQDYILKETILTLKLKKN